MCKILSNVKCISVNLYTWITFIKRTIKMRTVYYSVSKFWEMSINLSDTPHAHKKKIETSRMQVKYYERENIIKAPWRITKRIETKQIITVRNNMPKATRNNGNEFLRKLSRKFIWEDNLQLYRRTKKRNLLTTVFRFFYYIRLATVNEFREVISIFNF